MITDNALANFNSAKPRSRRPIVRAGISPATALGFESCVSTLILFGSPDARSAADSFAIKAVEALAERGRVATRPFNDGRKLCVRKLYRITGPRKGNGESERNLSLPAEVAFRSAEEKKKIMKNNADVFKRWHQGKEGR